MKKVTTISALAVLAGIAIYDVSFREGDGAEGVSGRREALDRSAELNEVRRKRAPLTKREIVDQLPKVVGSVGLGGLKLEQSEQFRIFERLGALEGEAAVDFLFEKYGKSQSSYLPMTYAMRGWMEEDLEAGLAAFKGFLTKGQAGFASSFTNGGLFQWKGERFHSGLS